MLKALVCASWRRIVILGLLILLPLATASQTASHNKMSSIPSPSQVYLPLLAKSGEAATISTITPNTLPNPTMTSTLLSTPVILPTATATMMPTSTEMPTATAIAMPTATASATLEPTATTMPTITPTATVTPTAVCTYATGVYPIALPATMFDEHGFKPPIDVSVPYGLYSDDTYKDKTWRRIYLASSGLKPDQLVIVKWSNLWGQSNFVSGLTGAGNLDQGFDEVVPWPDVGITPPAEYPILPHRLNAGDWIYGFSDASTSGIQEILKYHVDNHTMMILPIIDASSASGNNSAYHASGFGKFFLLSYSSRGGSGFFLDLVYLEEAQC